MLQLDDAADCCGCTACESVCPKDAISMKPDALGFLYPEVDMERCVDCGLCEKVCAFNDRYDTSLNLPEPKTYGARHRDMREVETSRSGGAFIAISDRILERGGVVYGVGFGEHFRVMHKRATTKQERDVFKGSKYVQSDLSGIFRQVKADLKAGKEVLFSGTPCQAAGLASYIGKGLRDRLFLVDIVCHGTPGPKVWEEYLKYWEKKGDSKIVSICFRDKARFGWRAHRERLEYENGKLVGGNNYSYLFYTDKINRHSCAKCHFSNTRRVGDITIADFWGWEKTNAEFNKDDKGVSLLLVNTENGERMFDAVKGEMRIFPARLEDCIQPNMRKPSTPSAERMAFERDFAEKGMGYVLRKYGQEGVRYKASRAYGKMKNLAGRILRKLKLKK